MNMWLVGAGYWGSKLLSGLEKLGVEGRVIDIKNGQTIDDINDKGPVMLATPLWEHYGQTMELLSRGHDVYVEKPAAESCVEVSKMSAMLREDQLLMVGHIFIHHPQLKEIKDMIALGTIGRLQHITSRRLNWGIYQTRTTPVLSLAAHDISIILDVCGNSANIYDAHGYRYSDNTQHDRILFRGAVHDVTFEVDVSWAWPVRTRETIFHGRDGQIIWDQDANTVTLAKNRIENKRAVADTAPVVSTYRWDLTPLEHELKHWVDCVNTRTRPTTDVNSAYHVARVIDQVHNAFGKKP
jgi:predicted dehydrogenase